MSRVLRSQASGLVRGHLFQRLSVQLVRDLWSRLTAVVAYLVGRGRKASEVQHVFDQDALVA